MSASKPRRRKYVPTWEGEIEGWLQNFLSAQLWRVTRTMDRDDCVQEARIVFLRLCDHYPDVQAREFMALFKRSWTNHYNDLSSIDSKVRLNEITGGTQKEEIGDTGNEGELRVMLRQAPREVKMVLELMLRAPQEILDLALAGWIPHDKRFRSRNTSARLNALLGLPAEQNTMRSVHDYFLK